MPLLELAQAPVPQVGPESWEIAKGVMLTLSTMGVAYLVKTVRALEFAVRGLQVTVTGEDGKNGLRGKSKEHDSRLAAIEKRNEKIDAVTKYEAEHYDGPERRMQTRRQRDKEFPNPLDDPEQ